MSSNLFLLGDMPRLVHTLPRLSLPLLMVQLNAEDNDLISEILTPHVAPSVEPRCTATPEGVFHSSV